MRHKHREKSRKLNVRNLGVATFLTCAFSLSSITAQTIYVKKSIGTQTAYALSNLRKIAFSPGNVTVQKADSTTEAYVLSELRYVSFKDFSTGVEERNQISTGNLITYPNPVSDVLNIDLSGSKNIDGSISIISLEGKVLQQQKINDAGIIRFYLSQLPNGIYLCRYRDDIEIKTVKIIKH